MRKYLQISFQTLTGIKSIVDLGDFVYGEWIIYDSNVPKYHIIATDTTSNSNKLINSLINSRAETIESIIQKINTKNNTRLSLEKRPLVEIIKNEESIELDLAPLPEYWIENI